MVSVACFGVRVSVMFHLMFVLLLLPLSAGPSLEHCRTVNMYRVRLRRG